MSSNRHIVTARTLRPRRLGRILGVLVLVAATVAVAAPQEEPGTPDPAKPRTIDQTDPEWWALRSAQIEDLPAEAYRTRAMELLSTVTPRGTQEARRLLDRALELYPREAGIHAALAEAIITPYRWTWDRRDALPTAADSALARARELDPESPDVLRAAALLAMLDDRLDDAEENLRAALAVEEDVDTLRRLGSVLRIQDRFREAYFVLDRAVRAAPDDWRGYWALGDVYRDDRWFEEALVQYRKALELNHNAFPPKFGRVLVYQRYGHRDMALRYHKELLGRHQDFQNLILFSGGLLQMELRQYDKAMELLKQVSFGGARGLCEGSVLYRMGVCRRGMRDAVGAAADFRRAIEEFPQARDASDFGPRVLFDASRQLAALHESRGEPEKAMEVLERAAGEPDAPIWLHLQLAAKLEAYRLHDRAAQMLRRGLELEVEGDRLDERLRLRVDLARAVAADGHADRLRDEVLPALEGIQDEVREDGGAGDLYWLAKGFALAGAAEQAVEWLETAIEAGYVAFDMIRADEDLSAIRDTPGYRSLLEGR